MLCHDFGKASGHVTAIPRTTGARTLMENIRFGLKKQIIFGLRNTEKLRLRYLPEAHRGNEIVDCRL